MKSNLENKQNRYPAAAECDHSDFMAKIHNRRLRDSPLMRASKWGTLLSKVGISTNTP